MAQQIGKAVSDFELRTGSHPPKSMTVVLSDHTLVITLRGALSPIEHDLAQSSNGVAHLQEFHRDMFANHHGSLRQEIKKITGVEVCEASTYVEPATGAVVMVSATGTVVHVLMLAAGVPACSWTGNEPDDAS
jgi:uncharacterized protein YbcI